MAVVLFHGWPGDPVDWRAVVSLLDAERGADAGAVARARPLFPPAWGGRLGECFAGFTVTDLPGAGHFSPLEAPEAWAGAIRAVL